MPMRTLIILIFIVFTCLSIKTSASTKPLEISLNSIVMFALNNNPDIEIFWQRYMQSKYSVKEAQADYFPQVTFNAQTGREYNDPTAGTTTPQAGTNFNAKYGLSVEQLIFDGFSTLEDVRKRKLLSENAFWKTQAKVEEIIAETIEVYLDVVRYQKELDAVSVLLENIKKTVGIIEDQYEAGASGKVMLDYANSRLASAVTEFKRAQSSLNDSISNLEYLTGKLPPTFKAYYPEELNPDKLDLQYYLDTLKELNSDVVASGYEVDSVRHALREQKGKYLPEINLVIQTNQSHNDGGSIGRENDASATIRLEHTIFDGFKREAASKRIQSQITEASVKRQKAIKEITREVKQAYNQVTASRDSLKITNEEIRSSKDLMEINEENFKSGNINVIELIESAERLNGAKLKKIKLNDDLYKNAYTLLIKASIIDQSFFCEGC